MSNFATSAIHVLDELVNTLGEARHVSDSPFWIESCATHFEMQSANDQEKRLLYLGALAEAIRRLGGTNAQPTDQKRKDANEVKP